MPDFFKNPILNSPYAYPGQHWELEGGQPTGKVIEKRRACSYLTPIPKSKKRKNDVEQADLFTDQPKVSVDGVEYDPTKSYVNLVVCDSGWEAQFCRAVESHPRVLRYVKNQGLGLEVPYRSGEDNRRYHPDFIVVINLGDEENPELLNLIVEVKGYRRENEKAKQNTMRTYWVPGVNNLKTYGRWAFAEFTEVYGMDDELEALITKGVDEMIAKVTTEEAPVHA